MKRFWLVLFSIVFSFGLLSSPSFVLAGSHDGGGEPADTVPLTTKEKALDQLKVGASDTSESTPIDPRLVGAKVIQVFASVLGTVMLVLIFIAGYWFVTARGEEEKTKKGLDTIKRAVIGLIIALAAYGISKYLIAGIERAIG